jgi:Xaa-Pro dipeptidase
MSANSANALYSGKGPRQHGAMEFSDAPTDLHKVREYRLGRLREQLRRLDYAGILMFDQVNTRYATDSTNMQIWCSHYETRCVFVATEGPVVLFDYMYLPHVAEQLPLIDEYRAMSPFHYFSAADRGEERVKEFAAEISDLVNQYGGGNKRLAIDRLSHMGIDALASHGIEPTEGLEVTELARVIKSPEELVLMHKSMDVCEAGVAAMHEAMEPGITENALWAKLHETNIRLGGEWIETRLLSSGPRTNPWFRECSMRAIEKGDMVCFDTDLVGPYGYCSDISRGWVCDGQPNDEQRRLYAAAYEQLQHNISILKAGKEFREVAEQAWRIPDEFHANRYGSMGHGIGLADEYPSIKHWDVYDAKGYDGVFEENMVFCVEACIGTVGGNECIKLEEQVVITAEGTRLMSSYPLHDEWA